MPGIAGFVSQNNKIVNPGKLLSKLVQVNQLEYVHFDTASYAGDDAVILNLSTGLIEISISQPAVDNKTNIHLFVEGEIFDTRDTATSMAPDKFASMPECLLALYVKHGLKLADVLNGEFTIAVFQKKPRRLTIFADHLSTQPMYYIEQSDGLYFGSEKKSVLAACQSSVAPDPIGILQIFRHTHNIGDRTYIESMKRLPPGGILVYEDGRLTVDRQRHFNYQAAQGRPRWNDLLEQWSEHLHIATRRRFKDGRRVAINLSAGLDSRAVVSSIPREFSNLWARTRGSEDSHEVKLAKAIARNFHIEHYIENPEDFALSQAIARVVWRTEGEATFLSGPTIFSHSIIKAHGDYLAGGQLGDITSGGHINPRMLLPAAPDQFALQMYDWYARYSESQLAFVFTQEFLDAHMPLLKAEFIDSYSPLQQERNVDTHQVWDLCNRQTRMTMAAMPVDSHLLQRINPFYDRDLVDFALTIPLAARIGQALYKSLIYEVGPEIRGIPNANTLRTIKAGRLSNRLDYLFDMGSKIVTKAARTLNPSFSSTLQRGAAEDNAQLMRQDPNFRRHIENFCASEHFDDSMFNRSGIGKLLDEHYSQNQDHSYLLGLVATFASALPYFVYERPTTCPPRAQPFSMG